jgi:hypothetical protein
MRDLTTPADDLDYRYACVPDAVDARIVLEDG